MRAYWLAGFALLTSSLVNFLHFNGYPIFSLVTGIVLLFFATVLLLPAMVAGNGRVAASLASVPLAWLAIALHDLPYPTIGAIVFAALVYRFGERALKFTAVVGAVTAILAPLSPARPQFDFGEQVEGVRNDLVPQVRIVLDQNGPLDYSDLGYETDDAYFTQFHTTAQSVPPIIEGHVQELRGEGYEVETWQSRWVDVCDDYCTTYWHSSLVPVRELPLRDRLIIVSLEFAKLAVGHRYDLNPVSLNGREALERVVRRSHDLRPGEALVAHVIFPHSPFAFDADCNVKPVENWRGLHSRGSKQAYEEQALCAKSIVAGLAEDQHILLQSDHGNRIDSDYHALYVTRAPR